MSFEKAVQYLREKGMEDRVIVPEASSATVELAAQAIGVTPGEIAKTSCRRHPARLWNSPRRQSV